MLRDAPKTIYLKDYTPPEYLIDKADLRFELREEQTLVFSRLEIRRNPAATAAGALHLHGEGLELRALSIDGRPLAEQEYVRDTEGLRIARVPERFVLESEVRINPQTNTALEGLYKSGSMFCTQCEAEGFRKITWFIDRPDVMTRFTTTIVADRVKYPVLLSNGNMQSSEDIDNGMRKVV
ncbi:MAG TPA: aminopeptidase N, partial [Gammaproteobacteria bacterium]|nr:aminopeptidase N [Gammaproteobacteria bacterium]